MYLESKTRKVFGMACVRKKLVFHTEICYYFHGNNRKLPYGKPTFFLGKLYQKFFLFYNLGTHGILHTQFGLIWATP